jgi:hypothetical protein
LPPQPRTLVDQDLESPPAVVAVAVEAGEAEAVVLGWLLQG